MHPILAALLLFAAIFAWSPAPSAFAQQPTLDLERDVGLHDAVADARRLGLVTDVSQSAPGRLQLTVGPAFATSSSASYNLGRLYLAYAAYQRGYEGDIVLELLDGGEKLGEYGKDGLRLTRQPRRPPATTAGDAESAPRRGHWYGALGLGGGAADFTCARCVFDRSLAPSSYLTLGRRVGDRAVLGIEGTAWTRRDSVSRGYLYTIAAVVVARFDDGLPLFVSGGIGYAGYRRRFSGATAGADALGYSLRLGGETRVGRRLHLAPYIGVVGSFGQPEFTYGKGVPYGLSANFSNIQLGAAIVLD